MGVVFFWCGHVSGTDDEAVGPDREAPARTETPGTADPEGDEALPLEWIAEIMENREMLESLDLLEKLELFSGENRFSSHRFE